MSYKALLEAIQETENGAPADTLIAQINKIGGVKGKEKVTAQMDSAIDKLKEVLKSGKQRRIEQAITQLRAAIESAMEEKQVKKEQKPDSESSELTNNIPTKEYLLAFEKGAGKVLEEMKKDDSMPIVFTVGAIIMERSPSA